MWAQERPGNQHSSGGTIQRASRAHRRTRKCIGMVKQNWCARKYKQSTRIHGATIMIEAWNDQSWNQINRPAKQDVEIRSKLLKQLRRIWKMSLAVTRIRHNWWFLKYNKDPKHIWTSRSNSKSSEERWLHQNERSPCIELKNKNSWQGAIELLTRNYSTSNK